MLKFNTYTKQGNVGLGYCIAYYTTKGFIISLPLNDSQKYDLVVDIEDKLEKIQVKTTRNRSKNGNFVVSLRTISGRKVLGFSPKSFDILFVLTDNAEIYEIPSKVLEKYKNSITLSLEFDKYKKQLPSSVGSNWCCNESAKFI